MAAEVISVIAIVQSLFSDSGIVSSKTGKEKLLIHKLLTYLCSLFLQHLKIVYHKKQKTKRVPRGQTSEQEMQVAVATVLEGQTMDDVAKQTGISLMTLKRSVRKTKANPNTIYKPNFVTKQIFISLDS